MLEDSGDEEETNGIVNQVLDEIGIEISGKVYQNNTTRNKVHFHIYILLIFRCQMLHLLYKTVSEMQQKRPKKTSKLNSQNYVQREKRKYFIETCIFHG